MEFDINGPLEILVEFERTYTNIYNYAGQIESKYFAEHGELIPMEEADMKEVKQKISTALTNAKNKIIEWIKAIKKAIDKCIKYIKTVLKNIKEKFGKHIIKLIPEKTEFTIMDKSKLNNSQLGEYYVALNLVLIALKSDDLDKINTVCEDVLYSIHHKISEDFDAYLRSINCDIEKAIDGLNKYLNDINFEYSKTTNTKDNNKTDLENAKIKLIHAAGQFILMATSECNRAAALILKAANKKEEPKQEAFEYPNHPDLEYLNTLDFI